jgi:hypothetical protein
MQTNQFMQSPFAVLTLIAAPAILTNAASTLALSTINRMFRTRDRMHELLKESDTIGLPATEKAYLLEQVNRVERQAVLLLRALHSIYVALGAFAAATLVTLLAEGLAPLWGDSWFRAMAGFGIALGLLGVGGLVLGSVKLFNATRMSIENIRIEATLIRRRQSSPNAGASKEAGAISVAKHRLNSSSRQPVPSETVL